MKRRRKKCDLKMPRKKVEFLFYEFFSWVFRRRDPEVIVIKGALGLLGIVAFGLLSTFALETPYFNLDIDFGQLELIGKVIAASLIFVIAVCIVIMWRRYNADERARSKRRVYVIEGRGLRDDDGENLSAIAETIDSGVQVPILLDLRQKVDETIVSPEHVLPRISIMKESLNQQRNAVGPENTKVIYGGLTPVPFTFMTGVELDDEGEIEVVDWDRFAETWRRLDEDDDGETFQVEGLENTQGAKKVLLAVSVSFAITDINLDSTFAMPVVRLTLGSLSSTGHWSKNKQARLSLAFFETVKHLGNQGVEEIHLVLAAPNSVSFNFGRRYDRRNLPKFFIYQFEHSMPVKYPWSVFSGSHGTNGQISHTRLGDDGFVEGSSE